MGNYDGSVVIQAVLDATGVKKELDNLQKETSSVVGKWKVGFLAAGAAAAAVGVATAKVGKAAIDAYADYEQLVGGVETLFKDNADTVMEYADEAYKTAGMSANAYMETVTGFSASLLQSLGGDTKRAAELGNQAVIDMADNANKMGTDISHIQDAYQGFAKQNYTMLDNLKLGFGGTKSEMERLLVEANKINAEMGILTDYDINSFADIVEAIHVVQESMGIAGTTAQEAEDTIQGSVAAAKAAWENLLVGFADGTQDLDVLFGNLVDSLGVAAENLIPRIGQVIGSLVEMLISNAPKIAGILFDAVVDIGKNIVAGLWRGIKASWGNLIDHFEGKTQELIESAKADLDIHSPSGVFAEIGEYCMEGLAEGIAAGSDGVVAAQGEVADALANVARDGANALANEQADLAITAELSELSEDADAQIAELLGGVEGQLADDSPDVGRALSDGLAEGILAGKSGVVNAAAAVAAAAVRAAKRELDINSPSKKFRYLGEMSSAGFVGGIEGGAKQVKAAVSEMLSAVNLTPVVVESGRALTGGTTREIITNNRTVEKVARLEGDGLNNALVSRLRIKLQDEDARVGAALGV